MEFLFPVFLQFSAFGLFVVYVIHSVFSSCMSLEQTRSFMYYTNCCDLSSFKWLEIFFSSDAVCRSCSFSVDSVSMNENLVLYLCNYQMINFFVMQLRVHWTMFKQTHNSNHIKILLIIDKTFRVQRTLVYFKTSYYINNISYIAYQVQQAQIQELGHNTIF